MIAPKSQSGGGKVAYPTSFAKYHLDGHRRQGVVDNGYDVPAQESEVEAGAGELDYRIRITRRHLFGATEILPFG
jgi:hypothetical protein